MLPILQTSATSPLAVAGTFASLALFFSITAHIAARNVLGDVEVKKAFAVGPVPAAVAVVFTTFEWPPALAVVLAVAADAALVGYLYPGDRRLAAYVTLIHVVVSIILGAVLFGLLFLIASAPG